jgi:hypothetical protein
MPSQVICSLEQIIEWRGKPSALRCDNGSEYISQEQLIGQQRKKLPCSIFSQVSLRRILVFSALR